MMGGWGEIKREDSGLRNDEIIRILQSETRGDQPRVDNGGRREMDAGKQSDRSSRLNGIDDNSGWIR
jgi:hypothetical protein